MMLLVEEHILLQIMEDMWVLLEMDWDRLILHGGIILEVRKYSATLPATFLAMKK